MIITIISIILLVILSIILLTIYNKKKKNLEKNYKEEYYNNNYQEFAEIRRQFQAEHDAYRQRVLEQHEAELKEKEIERNQVERSLIERKQAVEEILAETENRKREVEKYYQDLLANGQKNVEERILQHEAILIANSSAKIADEEQKRRTQMEQTLAEFFAQCTEKQVQAQIELDKVREILDDFKKRQQVVNEEILRRRQVEEQQDFYRIKLSEADLQDINYLLSIVDNLKNKTLLYKLIWSEYLQRPFSTLFKNLSQGREIRCVIYKITNLNTGEIYIGKTKADVTKRWTEHIKTSLNIGTVSRTKIHGALFKHWHEFTFEVLEEVADEAQLSAREKFYINFYQSNIYGYNITSGG